MTLVRAALPGDADAIDAVHLSAFPTAAEARLVRLLEGDGDVAASIVAERDRAIVAHAMFSLMRAVANGRPLRAAGLAPVGVIPALQRQGIGALVVGDGIEALRASGFQICFVLGDPRYYKRFGFTTQCARPYRSPYAGPHFMALHLDSALAMPESGIADYAPAFARLGAG